MIQIDILDVKIENVYSSFGGKGNVMKLDKQITNEELLELTKKAFENNEVAEFLCGEKGYACPISHFVPANVPTDFSRIIDFGVYTNFMRKLKMKKLLPNSKKPYCIFLIAIQQRIG